MSAVAELIADRGEAASGEEFFRSRPFLDAEGVTHTLRIRADGVELLAPLVVREIPGTEARDATSPYGFPGLAVATLPDAASDIDPAIGGSMSDAALDPAAIEWSSTGLVSLFLRHTLAGPPPLAGAKERNVVQIADPALPRKSRPSDRNQINRNRRAGYEVRIVPGPQSDAAERADYLAAYEQTMRRTGAAERYFFDAGYFDGVLASPASWLALVHSPDGEVAAGSIAVRSDGYLHYYLSGTADASLRDSPMKNVLAALLDFAAELKLPLNLGGGIAPGDRLEEFKRGFANREQGWCTSEIVCDPEAYARLSGNRESADFFPAYRAG